MYFVAILFPLLVLALYLTTVATIYGLTGWPHAAKVMPAPPELRGRGRRCWVARLMVTRMNGLLKLAVLPEGLYLELPILWRLNAGNILVPWHRIEGVETDAGLWGPIARIDIENWASLHGPIWILEDWEAAGRPGHASGQRGGEE
ncbi:MAG: hypothetical protein VX899_15960 [Myxococcota bacterium]|nr:hypothetical protein [Myxococcota bacterium]